MFLSRLSTGPRTKRDNAQLLRGSYSPSVASKSCSMLLKPQNQKRRGAVLVEYALLIAGVALISAAAVSLFGHKTSDLIATVAAVLPGAHVDDNAPVMSGHLIETGPVGTGGSEALDITAILAGNGAGPPRNERHGAGFSGSRERRRRAGRRKRMMG